MKPLFILIPTLYFCIAFSSCNYIKDFDKPHLELSGNSPYRLEVTNFIWSYGLTGINELNGDFERLDEKVFDALKGKTGTCTLFIENQNKDQYGKVHGSIEDFGQIDLRELNKYEDWHYWHNNAGIRPLILEHIKPKVSEPIEDVKRPMIDSTDYSVVSPPKKLAYDYYLFSLEDLHPSEDDKADIDSNTYVVEGTITQVSFDKGTIEIKDLSGKTCIADFSPYEVGEDIREKLKLAVRPGNSIKSLCDFKGGGKVELVAAKITDAVGHAM